MSRDHDWTTLLAATNHQWNCMIRVAALETSGGAVGFDDTGYHLSPSCFGLRPATRVKGQIAVNDGPLLVARVEVAA